MPDSIYYNQLEMTVVNSLSLFQLNVGSCNIRFAGSVTHDLHAHSMSTDPSGYKKKFVNR